MILKRIALAGIVLIGTGPLALAMSIILQAGEADYRLVGFLGFWFVGALSIGTPLVLGILYANQVKGQDLASSKGRTPRTGRGAQALAPRNLPDAGNVRERAIVSMVLGIVGAIVCAWFVIASIINQAQGGSGSFLTNPLVWLGAIMAVAGLVLKPRPPR